MLSKPIPFRLELCFPGSLAAEKLICQTGQRISVDFNPDNPAQAILESGSTSGAWGTLLIGIVFFIGGVVVSIIIV